MPCTDKLSPGIKQQVLSWPTWGFKLLSVDSNSCLLHVKLHIVATTCSCEMRQAEANHHWVKLVRDSLYIDGEMYFPEDHSPPTQKIRHPGNQTNRAGAPNPGSALKRPPTNRAGAPNPGSAWTRLPSAADDRAESRAIVNLNSYSWMCVVWNEDSTTRNSTNC